MSDFLAGLGAVACVAVAAFGGWLLIKRIGADRAGYIGAAVPIVALLLSTLFEDLQWQTPMVIGVMLCIAGNVLILRGSERRFLSTGDEADDGG